MAKTLDHQPGRGFSLAFIGGTAISFDIPLIRLAGSDPFTVMSARGFGLAVILFVYWYFFTNRKIGLADPLSDKDFLLVGTLSGINNICFTLAVFNTSTANVVFILAFNAMLAALISWPLTGEKPKATTLLAIAATIIGVGIIVWDSFGTGNLLGDALAMMCALLLALSLTLARGSGKDLSLSPGFGGLVSGMFALPMVLWMSNVPDAPIWLAIDALILVPIAGITLWLAPRYIPAPHVALFYLLETVLAPLWVWYVFSETPSTSVFIGGTIVVTAITAHALWELRSRPLRLKR